MLMQEVIFKKEKIPDKVRSRILGKSYPKNADSCLISLSDLSYLTLSYHNFHGQNQIGELICHQSIADRVLGIFEDLYKAEYQIEKLRLIDEYDADDERSMADNNSSCFNYRFIAGTSCLSNHAMGKAIDINPLYNPYIPNNPATTPVQPANGAAYVDRSKDFPHKIEAGDVCCRIFAKWGFDWGGLWQDHPDYQHFETV